MVDVPTVKLRDVLRDLPNGGNAGVVTADSTIRNDLVTNVQALPTGGLTGQALLKSSNADFDTVWSPLGAGDMLQSMYDPQSIQDDAFDRANHTGTQPVGTITGLATVATSGSYADLSGKPTYLPPRTTSQATATTLTPNSDAYDFVAITALASPLTIAAPSGTPWDGQILRLRLRDNGTSRALTWNGIYTAYSSDLPASTVVNMTMAYEFWFNSSSNSWDLVSGNPIPGKWA